MRLRLSLRSLPNAANHRIAESPECPEEDKESNIIKRMLKFSLLTDPLFIIFTVSNFCTSLGYNVPYGFLVVSLLVVRLVIEHFTLNLHFKGT